MARPQQSPSVRQNQKAYQAARGRALSRLAKMHPRQYDRLLAEERGHEKLTPGRKAGS